MPLVYCVHYWGAGSAEYCECDNFTVAPIKPDLKQQQWLSSGRNLGVFHPDVVKYEIIKHMNNRLEFTPEEKVIPERPCHISEEYAFHMFNKVATLDVYMADDDDYEYSYSGPFDGYEHPEYKRSIYKINHKGQLYCEPGGKDYLFGGSNIEKDAELAQKFRAYEDHEYKKKSVNMLTTAVMYL